MRELILKGYELVSEAYRQKFQILTKSGNRTFTEFAQEKAQLFDRWCVLEKINSYEKLWELILIEEFENCLGTDIRAFVNNQKADKLTEAARLADNYSLTHKLSLGGKRSNQFFSFQDNNQPQFQKHIPPQKCVQGRYSENFNSNNRPRNEVLDFHRKQNFPFQSVVVITVSEKDTQFQNAMLLRTNNRMVQSQRALFCRQERNLKFPAS